MSADSVLKLKEYLAKRHDILGSGVSVRRMQRHHEEPRAECGSHEEEGRPKTATNKLLACLPDPLVRLVAARRRSDSPEHGSQ